MGVGIMGQSKYTLIICTILKKTAMKLNCKTQLLGDKKQAGQRSKITAVIKRCMQNIEEAGES